MRVVAFAILVLLCGGCASRRFDLVARDPEAPWLVGKHRVRMESSNATISASYDCTWLDHLVFVVEVVNQTDSVLVVDPQRFTLTLASTGPALPYRLRQRFGAAHPEAIRAAPRGTAAVPDGEPRLVCGCFGPCHWVYPPAGPDEGIRRGMLHRIELPPGCSVRGEVWMPAWPLRKAIGYTPPEDDHLGITAAPAHAPADYQVSLHAPRELGGQKVEFSVAVR